MSKAETKFYTVQNEELEYVVVSSKEWQFLNKIKPKEGEYFKTPKGKSMKAEKVGTKKECEEYKEQNEPRLMRKKKLIEAEIQTVMNPILDSVFQARSQLNSMISTLGKVKKEQTEELNRVKVDPIKDTKKIFPKGIKLVQIGYPDMKLHTELIQIETTHRGYTLSSAINFACHRRNVDLDVWQLLFVLCKDSSGLFSAELGAPFEPENHYTVQMIPANLTVKYLNTQLEVIDNDCRLWKIFDQKGEEGQGIGRQDSRHLSRWHYS
ncbi:unnamed protein product [Bursaphelenchus okinawaensis]|uniref:Uncharacterized protein n=1 Tax=Bursaphelenchus okinawaensis TaxID=465554 RepID=A0A811LRF2_9BILA|nr:unnamed protein product [Bursaphelenchus okinawaensis]CAG9128160.1 unnamed protein product [Bursaphelenchus okinawaensis]